jgi:hypothetical protein
MDVSKYRKILLGMPVHTDYLGILVTVVRKNLNYREWHEHGQHADVLSGKGFWMNFCTLCMGYEMNFDRTIFRPIFSHRRQRLLDQVHLNVIKPDNFWKKVKSKYYKKLIIVMPKSMPIECIVHIIPYIW